MERSMVRRLLQTAKAAGTVTAATGDHSLWSRLMIRSYASSAWRSAALEEADDDTEQHQPAVPPKGGSVVGRGQGFLEQRQEQRGAGFERVDGASSSSSNQSRGSWQDRFRQRPVASNAGDGYANQSSTQPWRGGDAYGKVNNDRGRGQERDSIGNRETFRQALRHQAPRQGGVDGRTWNDSRVAAQGAPRQEQAYRRTENNSHGGRGAGSWQDRFRNRDSRSGSPAVEPQRSESSPAAGAASTSGRDAHKYATRGWRPTAAQPPVHAFKQKTVVQRPKVIDIPEQVTIRQLAGLLGVKLEAVQGALNQLGDECPEVDAYLGADSAELAAMQLGLDTRRVAQRFVDAVADTDKTHAASFKPRPPVVTVMGHVDHGKTSLLDALRKTSVAAGEFGGITQHTGAFVVPLPSGASITFLDTPGHAAFTAMRARGAAITDIVVLVVAADDGIMPQTKEALEHALAARVPIVVAINKCDKDGADPKRVRQQLLELGVELEEVGGDVQVVEISAKTGAGLDALEEALLLQAETMDLRADQDRDAQAVVVESRLDRGQGPLATVIVRSGVMRPGAYVVVGTEWGRVRHMCDMAGHQVEEASPATPVEITGLRGVPSAGDELLVVASEERARKVSQMRTERAEQRKWEEARANVQRTAEVAQASADAAKEAAGGSAEGGQQNHMQPVAAPTPRLDVIVKADVDGTAQAIREAVVNMSSELVEINIIETGLGPVSQKDVLRATDFAAAIVAFNVRAGGAAVEAAAKRAGVAIRQHRVIYHLLEDVCNLAASKVQGAEESVVAGKAEILQVFELKSKGSAVAGVRVKDGFMQRNARFQLLRNGTVVHEGLCASLRRHKLDVERVGKDTECGLVLSEWTDYKVGDVLQCIQMVQKKAKMVQVQGGGVRLEY
eukprot:jgi/Chlat1/1212/Chrsp115S00744